MYQAAEVAKTAAKSIADLQSAEESESSKEGDVEESAVEEEDEDEHDKQRKAALDKLEKASEDTILGQARHKFGIQINVLMFLVLHFRVHYLL